MAITNASHELIKLQSFRASCLVFNCIPIKYIYIYDISHFCQPFLFYIKILYYDYDQSLFSNVSNIVQFFLTLIYTDMCLVQLISLILKNKEGLPQGTVIRPTLYRQNIVHIEISM